MPLYNRPIPFSIITTLLNFNNVLIILKHVSVEQNDKKGKLYNVSSQQKCILTVLKLLMHSSNFEKFIIN